MMGDDIADYFNRYGLQEGDVALPAVNRRGMGIPT